MGIFSNIASAIFGKAKAAGDAVSSAVSGGTSAAATPAATGGTTGAVAKPMTREEVESVIEKLAEESDQDYNWNESIVDLMKLLKLDSSLNARKELAKELGYTGALNGSAEMNIWLHKQVMTKLAESGGVVPASLK
jgi:hypothetical protein